MYNASSKPITKTEEATRQKEGLSITVKGNIHQKYMTIIIVDAPNNGALKSIKQN